MGLKTFANLQKIDYFCTVFNKKSARSSMDRITDSGSVDWGSTPHGRTTFPPTIVKKILFILMSASVIPCSAQTYLFNWTKPHALAPAFPAPDANNSKSESVSNVTFKSGPVSFFVGDDDVTDSSQKARFQYGYTTMTVELRAYARSVFVVSVPDDLVIKEIGFVESQVRDIPLDYTGDSGVFRNNTWTATTDGAVREVSFDVVNTTTCTLTTVTVEAYDSQNGVADVVIEEECADEWYTVQGQRLNHQPTHPGMYVAVRNGKVRKLIVR